MDLLLPFHSRLVWHLEWPYGVELPTNLQGKTAVVNLHGDLKQEFEMTTKQATIFKMMIFLRIYAFLAKATSFYVKTPLHAYTVDFWRKRMYLQGFGGRRTQAKHNHLHLKIQKHQSIQNVHLGQVFLMTQTLAFGSSFPYPDLWLRDSNLKPIRHYVQARLQSPCSP